MSRKAHQRGRLIPALFFTCAAGAALGWWARAHFDPSDAARTDVRLSAETRRGVSPSPATTDRSSSQPAAERITEAQVPAKSSIDALAGKNLRLPIDGADITAWKGQFGDERERGTRAHEAVDILAPRGTEVHAVEDGTIEKLFHSRQGGITVYQFDPSRRFCYYYAHFERYAPRLREKQAVSRGDVIGYVGTSGNAPANTPHLHFAIFELTPDRHWWQGKPIDPWLAFTR
jgi:murein DD-endopeptidase MepM/ murein hydrolase activator NlpD